MPTSRFLARLMPPLLLAFGILLLPNFVRHCR
jgi:hypothetical protein